jgi:hypothetical protein
MEGETYIPKLSFPIHSNRRASNRTCRIPDKIQIIEMSCSAILVDAYKDSIPVLRWYLQTKGATTYIRLVLLPGKTEKEVKRWGPFPTSIFGLWHHVAFTVRFGRKYSATSADPAVVIAQAFMFFNGEPVDDQDSFKNKDLLNKYRCAPTVALSPKGWSRPCKEARSSHRASTF